MKTIQKFLSIIIIAVFPAMLTAQSKQKPEETVKYVTSIDCENCVNKIMSNLPQEKGIKDVKCDLKTKEVTVTYNKEKNNPEQIKRSIEKLGYNAKEVKAESSVKKDN